MGERLLAPLGLVLAVLLIFLLAFSARRGGRETLRTEGPREQPAGEVVPIPEGAGIEGRGGEVRLASRLLIRRDRPEAPGVVEIGIIDLGSGRFERIFSEDDKVKVSEVRTLADGRSFIATADKKLLMLDLGGKYTTRRSEFAVQQFRPNRGGDRLALLIYNPLRDESYELVSEKIEGGARTLHQRSSTPITALSYTGDDRLLACRPKGSVSECFALADGREVKIGDFSGIVSDIAAGVKLHLIIVGEATNPLSQDLYLLNEATGKLERLTKTAAPEAHPLLSEDEKLAAFVRERKLILLDLTSRTERSLGSAVQPLAFLP